MDADDHDDDHEMDGEICPNCGGAPIEVIDGYPQCPACGSSFD